MGSRKTLSLASTFLALTMLIISVREASPQGDTQTALKRNYKRSVSVHPNMISKAQLLITANILPN